MVHRFSGGDGVVVASCGGERIVTDLPVEENEALEAVDHIGYLIRRFATIKDREAGEHLVRDLATIRSALAAREYSKQREEKLEEALRVAALTNVESTLVPDEYECDDLFEKGLLANRRDICDEYETVLTDKGRDAVRAALAENGDTGSGRCGRVMVGYGGEGSHLPTCRLPEGHEGKCSTENGDTAPDGLGDRRSGA